MTFAIDFDGTFAEDPETFYKLVRLLNRSGHTTVMVTQRCAKFRDEIDTAIEPVKDLLRVIFASGFSKEHAVYALGVFVDVWIDDNPYSVGTALTYRGCDN